MSKNNTMKSVDTLTTQRLALRGMTEEDAQTVVALRSDPAVYRYFKNPHRITLDEHLQWYRNRYAFDTDRIDWTVLEKETGRAVGVFGIAREREDSTEAEVSYILDAACRGCGYAREALDAVLGWAAAHWRTHTAVAVIHEDNAASLRFARKAGFTAVSQTDSFIILKKTL